MTTVYRFKTKALLCFSFFLFSVKAQSTYTIDDPEDLDALSETLQAGDVVSLENGIYITDDRIKFSPIARTAALPIAFRA
ncbi:MAG: hypothetical protein ABJQ39_02530 [Winogradskyella arenosi]